MPCSIHHIPSFAPPIASPSTISRSVRIPLGVFRLTDRSIFALSEYPWMSGGASKSLLPPSVCLLPPAPFPFALWLFSHKRPPQASSGAIRRALAKLERGVCVEVSRPRSRRGRDQGTGERGSCHLSDHLSANPKLSCSGACAISGDQFSSPSPSPSPHPPSVSPGLPQPRCSAAVHPLRLQGLEGEEVRIGGGAGRGARSKDWKKNGHGERTGEAEA